MRETGPALAPLCAMADLIEVVEGYEAWGTLYVSLDRLVRSFCPTLEAAISLGMTIGGRKMVAFVIRGATLSFMIANIDLTVGALFYKMV